jgi:hypothetical protein
MTPHARSVVRLLDQEFSFGVNDAVSIEDSRVIFASWQRELLINPRKAIFSCPSQLLTPPAQRSSPLTITGATNSDMD